MHSIWIVFLVCVLYPLWLLAGAFDYICHRRTHIAETTGPTEATLHVVQFLLLACALLVATLFTIDLISFALLGCLVIAHSITAYIDVRYTNSRRYISPLEQQVHGFMDVIPLMAVGVLGVLHWSAISAGLPADGMQMKEPMPASGDLWLLLGSFVLLAGGPVLEEWVRVRR